MESPKVSIIIPVYNVEKYLNQCLDSILAQTFKDFEIILVDDGSTDGSDKICDDYANDYSFIKVYHKKNGGLSSARNYGLERANGEWIVFIDSDDLWVNQRVLTTLVEYASQLNLDILRFEYQAVDEMLLPIEHHKYDKTNIQNRVLTNYELVKYGVAGEWFAVLYLIRKSVIVDFRFDETIRFQEDIDFYCRLFAQLDLKCGYIDEKMYLYRKHGSTITTSPRIENLKCSFKLGDSFYTQSKTINHSELKKLYVYYSIMMYYWTLNTITEPPYWLNVNSVIEELKLEDFQKKVRKRIFENRVFNKSFIFNVISPLHGARLLNLKNRIARAINQLIN